MPHKIKNAKPSMPERLVDVLDGSGNVLHTYPVSIDDPGNDAHDDEYRTKALEAAASAQLVPNSRQDTLTARMHVSRGGALAPYGDLRASDSETKSGLEDIIRERAYFLWENSGRPEGNADEFWFRARNEHLGERAYVLWEQKGSPEGTAEANWQQIEKFEAH